MIVRGEWVLSRQVLLGEASSQYQDQGLSLVYGSRIEKWTIRGKTVRYWCEVLSSGRRNDWAFQIFELTREGKRRKGSCPQETRSMY